MHKDEGTMRFQSSFAAIRSPRCGWTSCERNTETRRDSDHTPSRLDCVGERVGLSAQGEVEQEGEKAIWKGRHGIDDRPHDWDSDAMWRVFFTWTI